MNSEGRGQFFALLWMPKTTGQTRKPSVGYTFPVSGSVTFKPGAPLRIVLAGGQIRSVSLITASV